VREIVSQLKAQGKTVMLNSHLLSEIEMTCDQVAILKAGQIVRQGKIDDLLAAPSTVEMRVLNQTPALLRDLEGLAQSVTVDGETVTAGIPDESLIPELVSSLVKNGGRLMSLVPRRESLEDLFIRVVETDTV
jgi:ABC-2 type transport system ATP-binding protein